MQALRHLHANRLLWSVTPWNCVSYDLCRGMAGHSKWANIKHTKAAMDAKRMKAFHKYTQMIRLAIKEGGSPNPKLNSKLSKIIEIAKVNNMPMANIENIIKTSQKSQDNAKAYTLEYKGPRGVFFLTEILTESLQRTKQLIATQTKKFGIQEVKGAAHRMFEEKGIIVASCKDISYEQAMDMAIEAGAEDVTETNETFVFTCAVEDFFTVKRALESPDIVIESADTEFIALNPVIIPDEDMELIQKFILKMEDLNEIIKVHVNL